MSVSYDQMLEISEQISVSRNRRLKILEQNEIDELYGLPRFSDEDREQYFAMTSLEMAALDELHSVKSKIAFILQLGYFKARSMFFLFNSMDVAIDIQYIAERYFPYTKESNCTVTKVTRLKHYQLILSLCRSDRSPHLVG